MADKFIEVPSNLEDVTILKRFLNELVDKLNGNALVSYPISYPSGYTGPIPYNYSTLVGGYTNTILEAAARADAISGDAKNYITGNLTTNVLQNTEDLATITEQFGTFYNDATAAAWYGLTVKSGELISGFTVSGVDSDTTTPGTAGSVFAISADTFTVGRAIEDIDDPAELAYIATNGLPYGTMYDTVNDEIIPAFMIDWNGTGYDIFFNGKTEFSNYLSPGTTTIDGGYITTETLQADRLKAGTNSATVWTGGGLISADFNGNPYGNIGTPTTGFRLSSNASGTGTDPNIYGAYIKGGIFDGGVMMLPATTAGNFGKEVYFLSGYANYTIPANATSYTAYSSIIRVYSPSYGSGLLYDRITSMSTSKILVITNNPLSFPFGVGVYHAIQVSIDGGTYYQIDTQSNVNGSSKVYQGTCPSFTGTLDIRIKAVYSAGIAQTSSINCVVSATCTILN